MAPTTTTRMMFHEGELAVQRRAGVQAVAAKVGGYIQPSIGQGHANFLRQQPFVVISGQDADHRVWATLLAGRPGFAAALDDRSVRLRATPGAGDPLEFAFVTPSPIGIIAIEFDRRRRIRLNGVARCTADELLVDVEEAFGNCPKFIQRRTPPPNLEQLLDGATTRSEHALDQVQAAVIRQADTMFVASVHAARGPDASHRGGRPGFIQVSADGRRLRFPDYSGNRMFQTLGNIAADPRVGLLFIDYDDGAHLQVTGRAQTVWDVDEVALWPGAERLVDVTVEAVTTRTPAFAAGWPLIEPSPLNPPLPE